MNAGLATHDLPDEYFVLQIDGRVRSGHRRFADALRAALLLRDQFPQHDVKVRAMQPTPNDPQRRRPFGSCHLKSPALDRDPIQLNRITV